MPLKMGRKRGRQKAVNPHKQRLSGSCRAAQDQRAGEEKGTKNRGNMLE